MITAVILAILTGVHSFSDDQGNPVIPSHISGWNWSAYSKDANSAKALLSPVNSTIFTSSMLGKKSTEYSIQKLHQTLKPRFHPDRAMWHGYSAESRPSTTNFTSYTKDGFSLTWTDNGVIACVVAKLPAAVLPASIQSAETSINNLLEHLFNVRPKSEGIEVKFWLTAHEDGTFEGNVHRNVQTVKRTLPSGRVVDMGTHDLEWHHIMFVILNGDTLVVRFPFNDSSAIVREITQPSVRLPG